MKQDKAVLFLKIAFHSAIFTILWIPAFLLRWIVLEFVKKWMPSYGKGFDCFDNSVDEDYSSGSRPSNSLVYTLVLEGILELSRLQKLFVDNVLTAKLSNKKTGEDKLRYPEFKQYKTSFLGYNFWKNDDYFNIANHITEQPFSKDFHSMSKVHQEMINKKYTPKRSPWDIVLVKNYANNPNKTLLVFRIHHTLADSKSCVKVLVECLGQKSLKEPNVQYLNTSVLDKVRYYVFLPFHFVYVQVLIKVASKRCERSHWIPTWLQHKDSQMNIAISDKISLNDVKSTAKKNNVTASAVIMAAVAGAVTKSDKRHGERCMPIQWVLPKMGHPDTLANHNHISLMDLPTEITSPVERLSKCNEIMLMLKSSTLHQYRQAIMFQQGNWFSALRYKHSIPAYFPLIISNIASDVEGFNIGSAPCSEFVMTSGATRAMVCLFSYKDSMVVTATVRDSILTETQTKQLVKLIKDEFEILKSL